MRIGCLQFAPQVGDVDNNLNRADAVLNRADPEDLDLLVLPELAFSGMSQDCPASLYHYAQRTAITTNTSMDGLHRKQPFDMTYRI